jgi:fructosamine-3-kinase
VRLPPGASVIERVAGGDINEAFRVRLADGGEAFVKTRADAAPGEYAAEAAALEWLGEPGALRTPRVLALDDGYLALEWITPGRLDVGGAEELGRGLAATHAAGADAFGASGACVASDASEARAASGEGVVSGRGVAAAGFGSLRLSNAPSADWPTFCAERRLLPLARIARERGAVGEAGLAALERVCERMPELTGPAEPPARLHGDLWSGNVMADASGRPWLIDPSAYGGSREVDLAMLRLFGAPSERVFDAYAEVAPLAAGWEERVELYQLLPLLVHALLFGGSYVAATERIAARYGAGRR